MKISRVSLFLLVGVAASALGACGRRGALEPPIYTQQGKEWDRRANGNRAQPRAETPAQGSVRQALEDDRANAGTIDIDGQLEQKRTEGQPATPVDPTVAPTDTPGTSLTGGSRRRPPGIVPPKRTLLIDSLLD